MGNPLQVAFELEKESHLVLLRKAAADNLDVGGGFTGIMCVVSLTASSCKARATCSLYTGRLLP